jgi:hypothetical protein
MKATITKNRGDYIDTRNDTMRTGTFWKVEVDGLTIRRPVSSMSKTALFEHIEGNFGTTDIDFQDFTK